MADVTPRIFVGIDWATTAHQVCVLDATGVALGERSFPHDGAGLAALCDWVIGLAEGESGAAWAAIEIPHGAVVETLLERGLVVHSINPKQLDRFRDRFTVAGAKDDRRDALVLADSLRTDPARYRRLEVDDPTVIELREWSRIGDDLQQERNRLCNRIREQLRRYYPQVLSLSADIGADWFLALWEEVPTPERARRVRQASVARILATHRVRKLSASEVLTTLRQTPVVVAPGTVDAATAHLRLLVTRVRVVNAQLHDCRRALDRLCARLAAAPLDPETAERTEQRDVAILDSMPGVGRIVLATLLAEASRALRVRDYQALRTLAGLAPVTKQSGKRRVVLMRQACNGRLRRATYHWARVATQHDPPSRAHYAALRGRGHSHGRALRGVADRLLAVACAALRAGTPYDPARRHHAAA
jgi:transposase